MIAEALDTIVGLINNYVMPGFTDPPLVLANISKVNDGDEFISMNDKLVLSIVNVEEDKVAKSPENFVKDKSLIKYKNPAIHLNLTVLFAATHDDYGTALKQLEKVIRFFQIKNVFTPENTPTLDQTNQVNGFAIERIVFDWVNLNLEQVHQLWTTLGGHYMPSVAFRLRMITIDEYVILQEALPIKEIQAQYERI
jgi:hypothetical protein